MEVWKQIWHAFLSWLSATGPKASDHILSATGPAGWEGFPSMPPVRTAQTREAVRARLAELMELSFDELVPEDAACLPSYVIPIENGELSVVGIYHEPEAAIVKCFAPAGSFFRTHTHSEAETIICISGQMEVYTDSDCTVLEAGQSMPVAPYVPHAVRYPVATWSFGITVPASHGFPAGVSEGHDAPEA